MVKFFLIFLGPPASGKGTQTDMLGAKYKLPVISTGELLRHERTAGTIFNRSVREKMDKGELVPDDVIEKLIDRALAKKDARGGAIFDGYPRNETQLKTLIKRLAAKPGAEIFTVYIEVGDREVKDRISGRRACDCGAIYHLKYNPPKKSVTCDKCGNKLYQRLDDKPAVIRERLKEFHRDNAPIIDYFKNNGKLITVNGEKSIDEVHRQILKELSGKRINAN